MNLKVYTKFFQFFIICFFAISIAGFVNADQVEIKKISYINKNIICITVHEGVIKHGKQIPYVKQNTDKIKMFDQHRMVERNNHIIGSLVGKKNNILFTFDQVEYTPLSSSYLDDSKIFQIVSKKDNNYFKPKYFNNIYRKSKPIDFGQIGPWEYKHPLEHQFFLEISVPLKENISYSIQSVNSRIPDFTFVYLPRTTVSSAIHLNYIGFHPEDPYKVAYLSTWMGNGGSLSYSEEKKFYIIDVSNTQSIYSGSIKLSKNPDQTDDDFYNRNFSGTYVYEMDFSSIDKNGTYYIYIPDIGISETFQINKDVWKKAFIKSARGLYHQRSGIEIGLPYSSYKRPRAFHPDDGIQVFDSICKLMDTTSGLNPDNPTFECLKQSHKKTVVSNAWGGYFDAGDWDRRIQHLKATYLLLDLYENFPEFYNQVNLNIPESHNSMPDIIDEALFNLDFYKRLQSDSGGVRGGIESEEHPRFGEASWQESLSVIAFAPDIWSSYIYTAVAAKAAYILSNLLKSKDTAKMYLDSAVAAMNYAENKLNSAPDYFQIRDERNLASLELYRLTSHSKYHDIFLKTTVFKKKQYKVMIWKDFDQEMAAFLYIRMSDNQVNKNIKRNCINSIISDAEDCLYIVNKSSFHWSKRDCGAPMGWGTLTVPMSRTILWAYSITGNTKYLKAAISSCQFGSGANPLNLSYTTGLGVNNPKNPRIVDSRMTDQMPPEGITVFGPLDMKLFGDMWPLTDTKYIKFPQVIFPEYREWPVLESFFDFYISGDMNEFTIDITIGPNAYYWGYIAGLQH